MGWSTGGGGASSGGTGLSEFESNFLARWHGSEETRQYTFDGSIGVLPSSFYMGSFKLSNGVQAVAYTLADNTRAIALVNRFNPTLGSISNPRFFALGAQQSLNVNTASSQIIDTSVTPFTLQYTAAGNNLTYDFDFIPATEGMFHAEYWIGTDENGTKIFDEVRTVTQAEVTAGTPIPFTVGNPYILKQGTQLFVKFSGINFKGDFSAPFGKNIPYFVSKILPYKEVQLNGHVEFVSANVDPMYIGCTYAVVFPPADSIQTGAIDVITGAYEDNGFLYYTSTNGDAFKRNLTTGAMDPQAIASPPAQPSGIYVNTDAVWITDYSTSNLHKYVTPNSASVMNIASQNGAKLVGVGESGGNLLAFYDDGRFENRNYTNGGWVNTRTYIADIGAAKVKSITHKKDAAKCWALLTDGRLIHADLAAPSQNVDLTPTAFTASGIFEDSNGKLFAATEASPFDFLEASVGVHNIVFKPTSSFKDTFSIVDVAKVFSNSAKVTLDLSAFGQNDVEITQHGANLTFAYRDGDGWYIIDNNDGHYSGRV